MAITDFDLTNATPMPKVGYAFVPMQSFGETYPPSKALVQGTVFPALDLTIEEYGKQYPQEVKNGN